MNNIYYYITCFFSGAAILILEVLGFRLFAPYFGYSIYVSGTLIGVVLLFLSMGYYYGGKLADRRPTDKLMYQLILAAAAYLLVIFLSYQWILETFQKAGLIAGTLLSTVVIYGFPMTLLSMVSPYLIRLTAREDRIGSTAGNIFAVSTVGSITGTFAATFFMIPFWGSNLTFALCVAALVAISIAGLFRHSRNALAFSPLVLVLLLPQYSTNKDNLIEESESFYNLIRVFDDEGVRTMMLNNPQYRQSYRPNMDRLEHTYREYFNLAPVITDVENVLVLGMSAGASVHELRHFFDVKIDAIEIDPEVVRLAEKYFDIAEDENLKIHTVDAKNYLIDTDKDYDFVEIDLFQSGSEVPFYVVTQEFFTQVYEHTSEDGIVMMNIIGELENPDRNMLTMAIANTFSTVFPAVFLYAREGNTVLIATKSEMTVADIQQSLEGEEDPVLLFLAERLSGGLQAYSYDPDELVFTDDRAPVAWVTHQVLNNSE